MKLFFNEEPRLFRCGKKNKIVIHDLGFVDIKSEESFCVYNNFLTLKVSFEKFSYIIKIVNQSRGYLLFAGTSWEKSHLIFVSFEKIKRFKEYSDFEGLNIYWFKLVEKYDELKTDVNIKLMSNKQITLKHEEKYNFDILSKNWGFYITPSFFSRCKSFNLLPLLLEKKDCVYLKILLVDKYSNKNLKLNDEYMKSIIHFNEPRKDSNINFINEVRGLI